MRLYFNVSAMARKSSYFPVITPKLNLVTLGYPWLARVQINVICFAEVQLLSPYFRLSSAVAAR